MITTGRSTSVGLEKTQHRIARWRATCPYRGAAMPAALWASAAALARLTRSSVLEIIRQDYIRSARALTMAVSIGWGK